MFLGAFFDLLFSSTLSKIYIFFKLLNYYL